MDSVALVCAPAHRGFLPTLRHLRSRVFVAFQAGFFAAHVANMCRPLTTTHAALLGMCLALVAWAASASAEPFHILAFGDSLTEGLTGRYSRYHPYATKLQELLQKVNPNVQVCLRTLWLRGLALRSSHLRPAAT